jgi:hypothetical protein
LPNASLEQKLYPKGSYSAKLLQFVGRHLGD